MAVNPSGRVMIVGTGMVGAAAAFALVNQNIAREILLVDIAKDLARSQMLDLEDSAAFTKTTRIRQADYSDLQDGDIVVVTSGAAQRDGMRRLDLLKVNSEIVKDISGKIRQTGKHVYVIMVTNPVDILTFIAGKETGLEKNMVMGTGTYLDSGRLQAILATKLTVNPQDITAYVFGEHGDSSFPVIGNAEVQGAKLQDFLEINDQVYQELMQLVRDRAYEIIKGKKSTHFGIATVVATMCRIIIRNENRIIPISVLLQGHYGFDNVCAGVLAKLGSNGYEIVSELELTENEKELFKSSVKILQDKYLELEQS